MFQKNVGPANFIKINMQKKTNVSIAKPMEKAVMKESTSFSVEMRAIWVAKNFGEMMHPFVSPIAV